MEPERKIRHYKGFEIHPIFGRIVWVGWQVRWHDENDDACSLAPEYPSIASAKRAINGQIRFSGRLKARK